VGNRHKDLGKLTVKFPFVKFASYLADNDIEVLQIGFDHLIQVATLDLHHRDPFDRIIIAQGLVENLTIITKDENFPSYTDRILWK